MKVAELKTKRVAVLGFGQEGQAVFQYLQKLGAETTIFDSKPESEWTNEQKTLAKTANKIFSGPDYLTELAAYPVIVRSPGFWRLHPALLEAEKQGSLITSQVKIFFANCKGFVIGVTGTKGKGTTCSLIYEIIKAGLPKKIIYLTGNIGKIQPLEFLDDLTDDDFVVYEMSSFQLQDLEVSPHFGICLMVTSDHLNHHENLPEYVEAKASITKFQTSADIAIANLDYEASKYIGGLGSGIKLAISSQSDVTFGAKINGSNLTITLPENIETKFDFSNRKLRGQHNMENIAAASLVGCTLNIPEEVISRAVKNFAGLEHRLQFVGEKNGVGYFNDSISTVPDTTIAAVKSFPEPIVLLLGGSEKGISYEKLVKFMSEASNIKAIITIGETGQTIKEQLKEIGFSKPIIDGGSDFTKALGSASQQASAGDVVLLSPASASFDMFENYKDRGERFIKYVNSL